MLDTNASRWSQFGTEMADLLSSLASVEEGACLVRVMENGRAKVQLSTGGAGEIYAGIAVNSAKNYSQANTYEEITIPATGPYTATLGLTPIGNVTGMFSSNGGALTVGAGAPGASGAVQQAGRVLTFHSSDAGKKVRIFYKRNLSVLEAQSLYGEFAGAANGLPGRTGIITKGEYVFTSFWDPASNWYGSTVGPVYTGANGNFTLTSGGASPIGLTVFQAPTVDFPFLGLNLR